MGLIKEKNKIKKTEESTILIYKPLFDEKHNILLKRYPLNRWQGKSGIIKFSSKKDQLNKMDKKGFRYFIHKDNLILKNSLIPQVYFYSVADIFKEKQETSKRLVDIVIAFMALLILFPVFILIAYKVRKIWVPPFSFIKNDLVKMVNYLK